MTCISNVNMDENRRGSPDAAAAVTVGSMPLLDAWSRAAGLAMASMKLAARGMMLEKVEMWLSNAASPLLRAVDVQMNVVWT